MAEKRRTPSWNITIYIRQAREYRHVHLYARLASLGVHTHVYFFSENHRNCIANINVDGVEILSPTENKAKFEVPNNYLKAHPRASL